MPTFGSFALLFALALSAYTLLAGAIALRQLASGSQARVSPERLAETARRAGIGSFIATTAAAFALVWAAFNNDFSVAYILHHSNRALPGPYKFAALWSGQEGSLLLWAWLLAAYGFDGTPGYFTGDILSVDSNPPGAQKGVVPLGTINEAVPASEAYQNRSQVFKLAYNFSPTTSLTLGSIGEQTYVDYTATLDTVEPVTIEEECVSCAPNGANTFNNPIYNGLIGKTVLASTSEDDLFLGNFELDNEPIFTADLRTTFGPGNFLGRYYTGAINRQIDDPEEANQVIACTTPSCSSPTLDTPFYESEIDVLHGADFEYSAPWGRSGQDVATVSYDQHSDLSRFCDGGSTLFTASDCSVNNLLLLSRTFSVRAFANVAPKLRVGFANYFSDTTFVGKRYDPRATIVWTPQRSTAVRFAVGTAYVAPPTSFVAPVAGENKAVVNGTLDVADDLKPETSAGVDLGADLGIHGDSKFTLDLYETALTNRFSTITILPGAGFGVGSTFGTFDGTPFSRSVV